MSEYVLSNELVSMALAMVAESPAVNVILAELFTVDGNELYIHPAARYLRWGTPASSACCGRCRCAQTCVCLRYSHAHVHAEIIMRGHNSWLFEAVHHHM